MAYRLFLFDFDGTLADSFGTFLTVANALSGVHGFRRIEPEELEELRGCDARQFMRHVGVPMWKVPRIARDMRRHIAEVIDTVTVFPGAEALLDTLAARGKSIAIVTSNDEANVRRVLGDERSALIMHYECGIGLFGKRARIATALRRCSVAAQEAIYIGDELRDLEAARAAGVAFGAVTWGFTTPQAFAPHAPDRIFCSMDDIAALAVE